MKLEKMTDGADIAIKRWYDDACGTALALELIGERWALLVVRELMFGPRRFSELRAGLPGISANILTQRLGGLERVGIVERMKLPPPASVQVYALTPWGYESEAAIQALGRWAARSPLHDPTLPLSAASLVLSFRTMLSAERLGTDAAVIGLHLGDDQFVATLGQGQIKIVRAVTHGSVVVLGGTPMGLAAIVYGGLPIELAERDGLVTINGSRDVARWFTTLFPLPAKVGSA